MGCALAEEYEIVQQVISDLEITSDGIDLFKPVAGRSI